MRPGVHRNSDNRQWAGEAPGFRTFAEGRDETRCKRVNPNETYDRCPAYVALFFFSLPIRAGSCDMSTRNVPSLWAPIVSLERFCDPGDPLETPQGSGPILYGTSYASSACGVGRNLSTRTCANMTHGTGNYASGRTAELGDTICQGNMIPSPLGAVCDR
jgi:hypothetical protein